MKQIATNRILNEQEYNVFKQIYKLYTIKELSEMFGITQKRVKNYLKELGAYEEEVIPEGMKKCIRCNEILPLEYFTSKTERKDGKDNYCKTCMSIRRKELEQRKRREIIDKRIELYKKKHMNKTFFCKKCNKEKSFNDYRIGYHFKKDGLTVYKKCKECDLREARKRNLKKVIDQGFYY